LRETETALTCSPHPLPWATGVDFAAAGANEDFSLSGPAGALVGDLADCKQEQKIALADLLALVYRISVNSKIGRRRVFPLNSSWGRTANTVKPLFVESRMTQKKTHVFLFCQ